MTVTLKIDDREVTVPKETLLVEAARLVGIDIPIFCYHSKMKPVGACRMCLVEIERMPKLQTACTTPVADGMVVRTAGNSVDQARKGVLEFLLTNHPLDCPVCDKGGECPLQDTTFRYGPSESRFIDSKRHFRKPVPLSPRIMLDRERCIMCFRCVRFAREIAGDETLTLVNRGSQSEVGVLPGTEFSSPFSGNTIELCPVGALTSRQFRFRARCWDLRNVPSVCSLCPVGCNVTLGTRKDEILRIVSRENTPVDDGWLCDRGRFTHAFVGSPERLKTPLIRRNGQLEEATWDEALAAVASGLRRVLDASGPRAIGGIASPRATNEELYLFQKLLRGVLGTDNVDHRFDPAPAAAPLGYDAASGSIAGLEQAGAILVLGADPLTEQPVLDLRLKKAAGTGARLLIAHRQEIDLVSYARQWLRPRPCSEAALVAGLLKALLEENLIREDFVRTRTEGLDGLRASLAALNPARVEVETGLSFAEVQQMARTFAEAPSGAILYRRADLVGARGERLLAGLANLALLTGNLGRPGAGLYGLVSETNEQGAIDLGLRPGYLPGQRPNEAAARAELEGLWGGGSLPPEPGLDGPSMLAAAGNGLRALFLLGTENLPPRPPSRVPGTHEVGGRGKGVGGVGSPAIRAALGRLDFLVVEDLFRTPTAELAHVVLPGATFAEKDGTFTNLERRVQRLREAFAPPGEARADWRILQGLHRALGHDSAYGSPAEIMVEIGRAAPIYRGLTYGRLGFSGRQWPLAASGEGTADLYAEGSWRLMPLEF